MINKLSSKKYSIFIFICSLGFLINIFCINKNIFSQSEKKYAIATIYTPVLNTSDFGSVFGGENGEKVKVDKKGLIREMEFVAFPNTVFEIHEIIPKNNYEIYRITTDDYPYSSTPLYIDSRFVKLVDNKPENRIIPLLTKDEIIKNILSLEGYPYMWGGNFGNGISQMLEFYAPSSELNEKTQELWCLKGVDCSGLLYQSTIGATPRNTSSLIKFGNSVPIENKTAMEIYQTVKPLDLIVWNGHVIIVLDENNTIESTPEEGVHKSDLLNRIIQIMDERKPVNDWDSSKEKRFVIRRWIE